ncbi:MAG: CPBP family intramembrane metalloprotease [Luteolibacter sp.]
MSDLLALAAANPIPVQFVTGSFLAALVVVGVGTVVHTLIRKPQSSAQSLPENPPAAPPPLPVTVVPPLPDASPYAPPLAPGMTSEEVAAITRPEEDPSSYATPGVKTRWYNPLDPLVAGGLFLFFFFQAVTTAGLPPDAETKYSAGLLVGAMFAQFLLAGIVVVVVIMRVRPVQWLGLRWRQWPWALLIGPGCVISMWVLMIALDSAGYMKWAESLGGGAQDTVKLLKESNDPVILGLMAVIAVLVAPLCEEIIFRGYLYPVAKRFAGAWPAAIFSALVFGAAHGNLTALLPLFLLALLLVWLYEKTGSLWSTIAVHCCFNGATVLIQMIIRYFHLPVDPGL